MPTASGTKKNIVLISFDDAVAFWKYKAIFGEALHTPNLDRICAQSTAFHSAYCQAPVCMPSRASLMSGKSPHQSGVTNSTECSFDAFPPENMWPYTLKQQGYFCSSGGKMMRNFTPLPPDIHSTLYSDTPKRFQMGRRKRKVERGVVHVRAEHMAYGGYRGGWATTDPADDNRFYDHQVATSAMQFFRKYDGDAPFYREIGFASPHGPWTTPRRFKDMYDFKNIKKPRAWLNGFDENPFIAAQTEANIDSTQLRMWKKSVRNYFSAFTHADYHLGRVWDRLKSSRHADNTVVVILSDHGLHLGERNLFRKHTLWEQVANVPLIIHDPAQPVAQVVSDPVGLIDVGPTVMDYAGLPPLPDCLGQSLRPQVAWERIPDRVIPTFMGQSAAIRTGKYRFIRYEDGSTQFYDLSKDWWQTNDLGPAHPQFLATQRAHYDCCKKHGLDFGKSNITQAA